MKPRDITTFAIMGGMLLGLAAVGVATRFISNRDFRNRIVAFRNRFPERFAMFRDDLISEEMMPEETSDG